LVYFFWCVITGEDRKSGAAQDSDVCCGVRLMPGCDRPSVFNRHKALSRVDQRGERLPTTQNSSLASFPRRFPSVDAPQPYKVSRGHRDGNFLSLARSHCGVPQALHKRRKRMPRFQTQGLKQGVRSQGAEWGSLASDMGEVRHGPLGVQALGRV
jgi:hypothetical protein